MKESLDSGRTWLLLAYREICELQQSQRIGQRTQSDTCVRSEATDIYVTSPVADMHCLSRCQSV